MKTKLMLVFATLIASAFAGTLTDAANVFGADGPGMAKAIQRGHIWIETMVSPPAIGLKAYADAKAKEVGEDSFYVVITTQPQEWRISMNPVGGVSSEAVRQAGVAMAEGFKQGHHARSAMELCATLIDLKIVSLLGEMAQPMLGGSGHGKGDDIQWAWAGGALVFVAGLVILLWRWAMAARVAKIAEGGK